MKILLISDNKIFGFGGGSLEEHKYYDGLKRYASENGAIFRTISPDETFSDSLPVDVKKTAFIDILCRLAGHSTYIYWLWKHEKSRIISFRPNIIFLGRSRMGFIAKGIKKSLPDCKIICNMENVELDYVDGYFSDQSGLKKTLYVWLEKHCVKRDEKNAVTFSDGLNYLTERDFKRINQIYPVKASISNILPICIEHETVLKKESKNRSVVFIGSLNYGSNVNALMDFIHTVWMKYYLNREDTDLIIAGSNPNDSLKELIKSIPNAILFENYHALEDVVPINSMVIAPIQKGAGMKVKVAETLSMGLMIAASDEALVGYEEIIESQRVEGIIRANGELEYKEAIDKFLDLSDQDLKHISLKHKELYRKYYSYNRSRNAIAKLCDSLQAKK